MENIVTANYPATAKVLVRGENMCRTALGIANAYLLIYPDSTISDLNRAFPAEKIGLNKNTKMFLDKKGQDDFVASHKGGVKSLETTYFYEEANAQLTLKDGSNVAVYQMWTSDVFPMLVEWVKQYDVYVADFEKGAKGKLGYFDLEYLNNWKPVIIEKEVVKTVEKKKIPWWLWLLLLALAAFILLLLLRPKQEPQVVEVEKVVEKVVTVTDTIYVQELEEIEKNFNAIQFVKDKADLNDDAKFVLHDLAKLMEKNIDIKLRIVGHTSEEGDPVHNQKLSEARAKAAVDFLVSQGVAKNRLQYEGKGSSEPLEPGNHKVNRRTEFEVID